VCSTVKVDVVRSRTIPLVAVETPDDLAIMRDLLAKAADAIRHREAGPAMGKVVVVSLTWTTEQKRIN